MRKMCPEGAEEIAELLIVLAVPAEDPGSVSSTYMAICNSSSRDLYALF